MSCHLAGLVWSYNYEPIDCGAYTAMPLAWHHCLAAQYDSLSVMAV